MSGELQQFIARVESFEIDPGDKVLGFAQRLARENRWSLRFAQRVIVEYKRFCILAMRSGHPVTPSEQVDQAWHLHLTYTRSYWERFCPEALGATLHHEPTAGGLSEGAKFQDWYAATLASYQRIFGVAPPEDIWPTPQQRFAHAGQWQWINLGRYWLIPKRVAGVVAWLLVVGLAIPGCAYQLSGHSLLLYQGVIAFTPFPFSLGGTGFLLFYGLLCLVGVLTVLYLRWQAAASLPSVDTKKLPELSTEELAVLTGGGKRLAQVALVRLFAEDRIAIKKAGWFSQMRFESKGPPPLEPALDRDLYAAIAQGTPIKRLLAVVKPHFDRIHAKLVDMGLRHTTTWHDRAKTAVVVSIVILGVARVFQGWWLDEEVLFLYLMIGGFGIVTVWLRNQHRRVSEHGQSLVSKRQSELAERRESEGAGHRGASVDWMAMNVALLGAGCIEGFSGMETAAPLISSLRSGGAPSGSSGCGTGCGPGCGTGGGGGCGGGGAGGGGGCGGGGCGGCGGCGG